MVAASPQLLDRISAYAAELERRGVSVERIVLYGSHARGEARADSDVDIAVFSEAFGGPEHLEFSGVLSAAKWTTEPMIEAIGLHPAALASVPPISFLNDIVTTGRVVYRRATAPAVTASDHA